jgi:hypothetical protein
MNPELYARLERLARDLGSWREAAERLRFAAYEAEISGHVDDSQLVAQEDVAGELYAAIEQFNALQSEIASEDADGPAEFAKVGDMLHLVLLEITELGTRMYRLRSAPASRLDNEHADRNKRLR